MSVGFSTQDEATDVARSTPQGMGDVERNIVLIITRARPTPSGFPTQVENTTLHSIQVNDVRGATIVVK